MKKVMLTRCYFLSPKNRHYYHTARCLMHKESLSIITSISHRPQKFGLSRGKCDAGQQDFIEVLPKRSVIMTTPPAIDCLRHL